MIRGSGKPHQIRVVDRGYLNGRRAEFEREIRAAFEKSNFSSKDYSVEDVIGTSIGKNTMQGDDIRNVVALGEDERILGAIFRVPVQKLGLINHGGVGWFFTSKGMGPRQKLEVGRAMWAETRRLMKNAGYEGILATMGTNEGARYLERREGFKRAGLGPDGRERWLGPL